MKAHRETKVLPAGKKAFATETRKHGIEVVFFSASVPLWQIKVAKQLPLFAFGKKRFAIPIANGSNETQKRKEK